MSIAKTVSFRFIFYSLLTGIGVFLVAHSRPEETRLFWSNSELWREPILAGVLCGFLSALLGVYILLNRIVFISLAISQGASFGIFLSYFVAGFFAISLAESPISFIAGLVVALLSAMLFAWLRRARRIPDESLIGFIYVAAAGLTILIGDRISEGHHNIDDLLFGNAVAVTPYELKVITGVTAAILLIHLVFRREFLYASADSEFMKIKGLNVKFWSIFLYFTLTLGITFNLKTLGSLPVFALMVVPPLISLKRAQGIREAFLVSLFLGILIPPLGYYLSFIYAFPTGSSVIAVSCLYTLFSFGETFLNRLFFARSRR